ncbi:hypothetical protein KL918_003004 [Ogataea parapolymorpha]|uniref:RRM domain-containing protein n=1 Tax=Ogataea parapolymorpha (strain ATCC 26012 / BCRC 20466 / JCM 22074 / NRRL Y-7560 / DL-1) TaxID=871575 RepID=W1QA03_OGAPD|nr:hypothetical protein HPODL_01723 [Ogataea parapolymorpha DL-1]ESW97631.1 hypothetical protein HPODL_01723 [Ogataea parapolymorpha DL-1]KAG7866809.1 hypothetical protein KL918_003004 [Ogataea parapolymorpha]KAG7871960.1 hypothetical protein KL916_003563 [Ogataea parapolymorpha]
MADDKRRIYVGSMSKSLAENPRDLEQRFEKFGKVVRGFEIHHKEVLDYYYGYITLQIPEDQLKKLKRSFNGVTYKGSKLAIQEAKPDYKERWLKDNRRQDTKIKDRQIRERIAQCRLERIAQRDTNPFELSNTEKGRLRRTPRKTSLAKLSMRANIKGTLKIVRARKTKVWGYNKNKHPVDLVWRYIDGEWRDGNDHTVEKVKTDFTMGETEKEIIEEKERTTKMLESWMDSFDFNKPVDLSDDEELKNMSVSRDRENQAMDEPVDKEPAVVVFDEEDTVPQASNEQKDEDEDVDTEFLPSFLQKAKPVEQKEEPSASNKTTEVLRTLLNPTEPVKEPEYMEPEMAAPVTSSKKYGLFFSHSKSPFLSAQTQLATLKTVEIGEEYDKWFWENRGDLNRYFRRRRRDVLRQAKKGGRAPLI